MDLGTAARRRQAVAAPVQPQPMDQPYAGPGLPQLQTPTQTTPAGSLSDGTGAPSVPAYANGGRVLAKPRALQAGPGIKEMGARDQVLNEPVAGVGLYSGKVHFVAGEKGPERIAIGKQPGGPPQVTGAGPGVRWFAVGGDVETSDGGDATNQGQDLNQYTGGNGGTATYTQGSAPGITPPSLNNSGGLLPAAPAPTSGQNPQSMIALANAYNSGQVGQGQNVNAFLNATTNGSANGGPGYGQGQGSGSGNLSYPASVVGQVGPGSTGPTAANIAQYNAQKQAFAAKQASLQAQQAELPAEAAQTQAQSAYYAEQQRNAQQELALEQQEEAALSNVPDLTATAERANEQANEDYKYGIAGVAKPQDIILPPGYNGPALPAGVRPTIQTQADVIAKQLQLLGARVGPENTIAQTTAEEAGTAVAQAQQQAQAADIASQEAAQQYSETTQVPPSAGLQWDELTGQWVTPMEYAQSHALNRFVTDPVNKVRVTYEELAQRTDAHGNILNLQTNQWQSPAPAGQEGNTFEDTTQMGYPGMHWVDLDNPTNVFVNGQWIDTRNGNFWVQTGENSGEWHSYQNGREMRLTAAGWTPVRPGGGAFSGGLDASGNPIGAGAGAGGAGSSGLSPNQ